MEYIDYSDYSDDYYRAYNAPSVLPEEYLTSPGDYSQFGTGSDAWTPGTQSSLFGNILTSAQALGKGLTSERGMAGILGILAGILNRAPEAGGGKPLNITKKVPERKVVAGKYGPLAQYAADGGMMQAYATGGVLTGTQQNPLPMEDGGFVMTEKAVNEALKRYGGITQLLPQAQLIRGPGTGTSDDIPATIAGRTPALVSNGEAYIPKAQVADAGGAQALYALMNKLQRRA